MGMKSNLHIGKKPKLLDQVRLILRTKHYSLRTEKSYINWIKRFIIFHNKRALGQILYIYWLITHIKRKYASFNRC